MTSETQVQSQTLPVGYQLEDYRITAVLGQGGFGITYKATDETLRRDVAIKEYLPQQFAFRDGALQVHPRTESDQELFEWGLNRFVDEGRALAMFRHPNIASVIRYIQQNGTAYLVMEFEEGMDLEHWLAGRDKPDEQRLVRGILVPVLEGLAKVHDKGLLHRDIKPDNIFIRRDGTPVLIDFGASRPHGPEATSRLTSIISAGYSPFEQYGTGERQGPWSDLYALAGTVYRVISGHAPVDAIARHQGAALEPAVAVAAGRYGKPFLEAVDKALSLDIHERPQSARELLTLLGVKPPPPPEDADATVVNLAGALPAAAATKTRSKATLAAGVLLAVTAAGAVGGYYYYGGPGRGSADAALSTSGAVSPATPDVAAVAATAAGQSAGAPPPSEKDGAPPAAAVPVSSAAGGTPAGSDAAPEPERADPLNEDLIIAGLDLSPNVRDFRDTQLASAMLEYTQIKTDFDQCQDSGCSKLPDLLARLQRALQPQPWSRADVRGSVQIQKPRRLDNADCPFMLDVVEQIEAGGQDREQVRTYCTSNGFDRVVQKAEKVS